MAALLEQARARNKNAYLQLLAEEGLAKQGKAVEVSLAERSLSQKDVDTRLVGVRLFAARPGDDAVELLASALEDKEARVRVSAAAALFKRLAREPAPQAPAEPRAGATEPRAGAPEPSSADDFPLEPW